MPNAPTHPVIRRAKLEDAAAVADYMNAVVAEKLDTITRRTPVSVEEERDFIAKAAQNKHSLILIALEGARVIGLLTITGGSRPVDDHTGLLGITVAQAWRGHGLGRALIEAAIAEARCWPGFCRIELMVVPRNTGAVKLYESLGFVAEGVKRKGINLRGDPEDDLAMALVW